MKQEDDDLEDGRRYNDQMMLIDRNEVCAELRTLAKVLGMSQAELLRGIVQETLPGLRRRATARKRERARRASRVATHETLDDHTATAAA